MSQFRSGFFCSDLDWILGQDILTTWTILVAKPNSQFCTSKPMQILTMSAFDTLDFHFLLKIDKVVLRACSQDDQLPSIYL